MHSYGTSVLYMCRLCKASFEIIGDFIEHKKKDHSLEFLTSNCIIFEDILILNTSNDEDQKCGSLSTVQEKDSRVPWKENSENPNVPVILEIENSLTDVDLDINHVTQQNPHDPLADSSKSKLFPISKSDFEKDGNNDTLECTRSYQDDDEAASDYLLQENYDYQETVEASQASTDVYFYVIELESDSCEKNTTDVVDLNQFPQNPYVLLKKLSSKEIQTYSRIQSQETIQAEVPYSNYQCEICNKKSNSKADLQIHCKVCIPDTSSWVRYCAPCNKFFNSKWARNIHQIRHHGADGEQCNLPKLKCRICQKPYSRKTLLRKHMNSHNAQSKPFKCDQCSASFPAKYFLTRHQAIHASTRPFKCLEPNCGKAFKIKDHLTNHVKFIHANIVEAFHCPEPNCTSAFKYKSSFERHFRTFHAFNEKIP